MKGFRFKRRSPEARVAFSCVVDSSPVYRWQCFIFVTTLLHNAGVPPSDIYVHLLSDDEKLEAFLQKLSVNILKVSRWGDGKYCNKLVQLESTVLFEADYVVLCDCDIAFAEDIRTDIVSETPAVMAKTVDAANPSLETLAELFTRYGFETPAVVKTFYGNSYACNCNGGLLVIPAEEFCQFGDKWKGYAKRLLADNEVLDLLGERCIHVDQIAFALALLDTKIPFRALSPEFNMPTHQVGYFDNEPALCLMMPRVIHYHWTLDEHGLLNYTGKENIDAAIKRANAVIGAYARNELLWPYQFAQNLKHVIGKTVFLHIGTSKTGSSSLQYWCNAKRELLRENGIHYPAEVLNNKHQMLVELMLKRDFESCVIGLQKLFDEASECHTIVLSAEGLYNHIWDFNQNVKQFWAALASVVHLKVVVYMREQGDFLESYYRQGVLNPKGRFDSYGVSMGVREYIELDRVKTNLNYNASVSFWEDIVGKENMIVRPYCHNTIADFMKILGFDQAEVTYAERKNISLPTVMVELIRRCNHFLDIETQKKIVKEAYAACVECERKTAFVDAPVRRLIEERYASENRKLLDRYPVLEGLFNDVG